MASWQARDDIACPQCQMTYVISERIDGPPKPGAGLGFTALQVLAIGVAIYVLAFAGIESDPLRYGLVAVLAVAAILAWREGRRRMLASRPPPVMRYDCSPCKHRWFRPIVDGQEAPQ